MTSLPKKPEIPPSSDEAPEYISLSGNDEAAESTTAKRLETSETTPQSVSQDPPLPDELPPPLPDEAPPSPDEAPREKVKDDGWEPVWDANAGAFYFYNRYTQVTQWENPRISSDRQVEDNGPPGASTPAVKKPPTGGYDPAIHGDYDPNADYAKSYEQTKDDVTNMKQAGDDPAQLYNATAAFNRFTGKWQAADINAEKFNDENKSRRQMNAFFDVDAAANSHDGRSLKAERSNKKLSKAELKAFREKRKEKKEEKRRAWLRD